MKRALLIVLLGIGFSASAQAESLEIRPFIADRFEGDCGVRRDYDFHDENNSLSQPLAKYVVGKKSEGEERVFSSTTYKLKNVFYDGIPVVKIDFGFGNLAKQMNEELYLDLREPKAKAQFQQLQFKQQRKKDYTDIRVRVEKNIAIVHCY
jgi:hypothetical protein